MSLEVTLPTELEVVTTPAVTTKLATTVKIERIVDIPSQKEVAVFVEGLGRIVLADLSGVNYDKPAEWSNSDIVAAVTAHINSLSR